MNEREQRVEISFTAPNTIPETEPEMVIRERAKHQYFSVNRDSTVSAYDAGWKAAKAYYEVKE